MSSAANILSVINNLEYYEDSEEGRYEKMLSRLEQQCAIERAKRTSIEIAIEKFHSTLSDISFVSALNKEQNKVYKNFRTALVQNVNMQEKLVRKVKSYDWEQVNSLWRFKFNVILEKNETKMRHYQDQQNHWKMKMSSITTIDNLQENQRIFEENQEELLELEKQWEIRMQQVDNKLERTKKNLQNVASALASSEEIVMNLMKTEDFWDREVKHIDKSKLEKTILIKDLQQEIKKLKHEQLKEIGRKKNLGNYLRTRDVPNMDEFKVPSFPILKMRSVTMPKTCGLEEIGVKTLIEDRKRYAPLPTWPTVSDYSPRKVKGNTPKGEYSPSKIIDNKLKQDKQIKILEHIVLKSPMRETAEDAVTEPNLSSLVGQKITMTPKILKILQQSIHSATHEEDSKQDTGENDGEQFVNRQIIEEDIHRSQLKSKYPSYTTELNTKDDCKSDNEQEKKAEHTNVLKEKNIIKQELVKSAEKDKKKRANDIVALDELKCEETELTERGNVFDSETKPEVVPSSKLNEREDSIENEIKVDEGVQTSKNHLPESQELFFDKTYSNVNKRKSDNPASTKENPNAKHFKSTTDNNFGSHLDSSPLQSVYKGEVNVGDNSGSGDEMDKMLRKAFELCVGEETSGNMPQDIKIDSNDDFESFCNRFKESDNNSNRSEKGSNDNNDDVGWSAFGNAFKFETTDGDDGGFSSNNKSFFH